ncbi:MAG TPA: hypothetical protein P5533_02420 [Candidatus Cloacimonadota bacterium]|nr:hypothetical protein [Candidatus Cloacimonadota bacterium]
MPRQLNIESIKDKIPVRYRIHLVARLTMIAFALAIAGYSIFFLFSFVRADTPLFYKILPLVICFVGVDSLLKHLLTLNSITFYEDHLRMGYLAKAGLDIPYQNMISMELNKKITFYLHLTYRDEKGETNLFRVKGSFPKILEIILGLYELVPQLTLDPKMQKTCEYLQEASRAGQGTAE